MTGNPRPRGAHETPVEPFAKPPSVSDLQVAAVRGSVWTSSAATIGLPLSIAVNIVVARTLGPKEFGYAATLTTAFALATTVANMGVSDATIQWGAAAYSEGRRQDLRALVRRCSGFHLLVEVPLIVVVTAVLLRGAGWQTQLLASSAACGAMAIGTASVVQTLLSRTATLARVALSISLAMQAAVVVVSITSHSGFTTWAARLIVTSAIPFVLYIRLPTELRHAIWQPLLPRRWPHGFAGYSVKAGIGALASMLVFSRSEIFVLQAEHLTVAAGMFALAYGLSAQLTAPIDALLGPLVPAAASLAAAAPDRMGAAVLRGLRLTALASGVIAALGIPAVSALVPSIYGERYATVGAMLVPLGMVSCLQSLNQPVTAFIYAKRRVGAMLVINVVAFALDITVAVAAIRALGVWGAVLSNAVAQIVALGMTLALLRQELSLHTAALAHSVRAFGAGAVAGACGWLLASTTASFALPTVAAAMVGLVSGGILFVVLLAPGRPVLTHADLDLVTKAMSKRLRGPASGTLVALRLAPSRSTT